MKLDFVEVRIEEEDKALLLFASLLLSFDHIVTTLLFGKKTIINAFKVKTHMMEKMIDEESVALGEKAKLEKISRRSG